MFAKLLHPGSIAKARIKQQGVRDVQPVVLVNEVSTAKPEWANTRNYVTLGFHRTSDGKIKSWQVE